MRLLSKRFCVGAVALALTVCCCGCGQAEETVELLTPVGVEEETYVVGYEDVSAYHCNTALEVVAQSEGAYFEKGGYVGSFEVSIGEKVKKGQLLCKLDDPQLYQAYESLQTQISAFKTDHSYDVEQLNCDVEIEKLRLQQLKEDKAEQTEIRQQQLAVKTAQTALDQENERYQLTLKQMNRQLAEYQNQIQNQHLTAPIDGVVSYLPNTLKSRVYLSSNEPAAIISASNQITLRVNYMSDTKLKQYQRFTACIDDTEYELAVNQPTYEEYRRKIKEHKDVYTEFTFVDGVPEGATVATPMTLNMYYAEYTHVLTVPYPALKLTENGYGVMIMRDGKRYTQDITVEKITGTAAVVSEGLQEGDVVYVR